MKLPKNLMHYRHLKTKRGASAPPGPPPPTPLQIMMFQRLWQDLKKTACAGFIEFVYMDSY